MIRPVPHIDAMSPYALAQLHAPPGKPLISLSQNESLRPPSPHAIAAAASAHGLGPLYPDPDWSALRAGLAEQHQIRADSILCGSGSMELIGGLMRAFADEHNAVLAPAHAYPFFQTAARMARARFDTAPEPDGRVCVDALMRAIRPDTRILCVANPANPTGTRIPRSELVRLRMALPATILLVIDEAYGEFADHLDAPLYELADRGDTVILRSFSKAYGLAGARVGWGVFPPDIRVQMRKVMTPNNIPAASQAAATAALADQPYMRETCALTATLRDGFRDRLCRAGYDVPTSFTNFVLIRFKDAADAQDADRALRAWGVFLRPQGGAGLAHCLRATIGPQEHLDTAATLLEHRIRKET